MATLFDHAAGKYPAVDAYEDHTRNPTLLDTGRYSRLLDRRTDTRPTPRFLLL